MRRHILQVQAVLLLLGGRELNTGVASIQSSSHQSNKVGSCAMLIFSHPFLESFPLYIYYYYYYLKFLRKKLQDI